MIDLPFAGSAALKSGFKFFKKVKSEHQVFCKSACFLFSRREGFSKLVC
jgi:hypothetical protein